MKIASVVLAFSVTATGFASAAEPATGAGAHHSNNICLDAHQIDHTTAESDQSILYYMNNGKVWRNTLRRTCPGLKFENGFSEEIRGSEICGNEQIIYVLETGTPCSLGAFTAYAPRVKEKRE